MALLRAYFDESGTHGGESMITAIGGYVATKQTWMDLETAWRAELGLLADRGVRTFHMCDAIAGTEEYKRVDAFHRAAHIKRVSELLRDADVQAIGVWVDNGAWADVVEDATFMKAFPKPYNLCFEHAVRALREWARRHASGEKVVPMFAYTSEYSPTTTALYGAQDWYRDVLGALSFDSPANVVPLQAADFIAHQIRQDAHHIGYDELTLQTMGMTVALQNATARNGTTMVRGYDANALRLTINRFKASGTIW